MQIRMWTQADPPCPIILAFSLSKCIINRPKPQYLFIPYIIYWWQVSQCAADQAQPHIPGYNWPCNLRYSRTKTLQMQYLFFLFCHLLHLVTHFAEKPKIFYLKMFHCLLLQIPSQPITRQQLGWNMVVGARRAERNVSQTAGDLVGFSQPSWGFYREWPQKERIQLATVVRRKIPCWD